MLIGREKSESKNIEGSPMVVLRAESFVGTRANTRPRNSAESALSMSLRRRDLREGFNFDLDAILSFKRMINTRELRQGFGNAPLSLEREFIRRRQLAGHGIYF